MAVEKWEGDKYLTDLNKTLGANLEKAAIHLVNKVKLALNVSGKPHAVAHSEVGLDYANETPSVPGEPPHKMLGNLQRSITHAMSSDKKKAFVGTNIDYGHVLEVGGSRVAARPYLRATLLKEHDTLTKIIASGKG
jgi:phage gpG-like protein